MHSSVPACSCFEHHAAPDVMATQKCIPHQDSHNVVTQHHCQHNIRCDAMVAPFRRHVTLPNILPCILQNELVEAAQQELQDESKGRHDLKLQQASRQQAAAAAEQLLQAPAGFAKFSARVLRFYRQYGIEWPTVTVQYRNVGVTTKVSSPAVREYRHAQQTAVHLLLTEHLPAHKLLPHARAVPGNTCVQLPLSSLLTCVW